ncbi:MAG: glycosyltransferase family 4 protein [Candidatus Helarchaeota archaeon]
MRIAYIVQQFYPTTYGGGVHAFELSLELTKLGHEVHIITKGEPRQKSYENYHSLHIHRILSGIHIPYYFPLNSFILWERGHAILQRLKPDIIIGHGFESSLFIKNKAKNPRVPFIYKAVGMIQKSGARTPLFWGDLLGHLYFPFLGYLEKFALIHADLIIAVSNQIKTELKSMYQIPEKRITIVRNGVNLKRFHPHHPYSDIQKKWHLEGKKILIYAGRMTPIKGPQILLQAVSKIYKRFPNWIFFFIGDGPLLPYLKNKANELQLTDRVIFSGYIPNSEIPKYLAMAKVCVIPSIYEPFGLIALETLASGTPILTSGRGGLSEIHQKIPGYPVINPLAPTTLAYCLEEYLPNLQKLKKLNKNTKERIYREFSWRRCAEKTDKLLQKIKKRGKI